MISISTLQIYDGKDEFIRQGVLSNTNWRISCCNASYELCPTYPSVLAFPSAIQDDHLIKAAVFPTSPSPFSFSFFLSLSL